MVYDHENRTISMQKSTMGQKKSDVASNGVIHKLSLINQCGRIADILEWHVPKHSQAQKVVEILRDVSRTTGDAHQKLEKVNKIRVFLKSVAEGSCTKFDCTSDVFESLKKFLKNSKAVITSGLNGIILSGIANLEATKNPEVLEKYATMLKIP